MYLRPLAFTKKPPLSSWTGLSTRDSTSRNVSIVSNAPFVLPISSISSKAGRMTAVARKSEIIQTSRWSMNPAELLWTWTKTQMKMWTRKTRKTTEEDDEEDEGDDEQEYLDLGDSKMDVLFRMQDIRGKNRVYTWQGPEDQKNQEEGGITMATRLHAEAEEKKDKALAEQVALKTQLETVRLDANNAETKWERLQVEYGRLLGERDEIKRERDEIKRGTRRNQTRTRRKIESLRHLVARVDVDSDRPRKRVNVGRSTATNTEISAGQTSYCPAPAFTISSQPDDRSPTVLDNAMITCASNPSAPLQEWQSLLSMQMPGKNEAPELFARWIQFHELTNIKGVPMCGPEWVVDLRNIRGYHQVMARIPPKTNQGQRVRKHRSYCLLAIVKVLAIPGEYANLVRLTKSPIASSTRLDPLPITIGQQITNEEVTRILAAQGLTVAVADDAWQFCFNYLKASAASSPAADTAALLVVVETALKNTPPPSGLHPASQDQYKRENRMADIFILPRGAGVRLHTAQHAALSSERRSSSPTPWPLCRTLLQQKPSTMWRQQRRDLRLADIAPLDSDGMSGELFLDIRPHAGVVRKPPPSCAAPP
ncbi:hypothetical protein B0H14DRAFT_3500483 [Mycena olivaceomarginata]|nr:hypothetical protein B0H14DRAFT_3500483 [Mycena olivaceomarginata]